MMTSAARHLAGVVCLAVVILGGYLASLWPQGRGTIRLERLPGPAVIVRDRLGVPCIWGASPRAAFFAMGYAHAQDRLWQLELMRRAAWGELARLAGDSALALDVLHRRLGFYRHAFAARSSLGEEGEWVRAYAHGITAYLRAHPTRLPPQFLLARLRPALWQTEDVLAIGAMVQWCALPCSLTERGIPTGMGIHGRHVDLASLPAGVRSFLRPIVVTAHRNGDTTLCALAWGAQPLAWVETGMVGTGGLRRGWSIPGWPVPHLVAAGQGVAAVCPSQDDPWRVTDTAGWPTVTEFLHDSPIGPWDVVAFSGRESAVAPAADQVSWWVSRGSSRFTSGAISSGLRVWLDAVPGEGADEGIFNWYGVAAPSAESTVPAAHVVEAGDTELEPTVPFGLFDRLSRAVGRVRGPVLRPGCVSSLLFEEAAPAAVMVEWKPGAVCAALMGGQSEVVGNPHRRDQRHAWSRGALIRRDMRLPDFSHGCALVLPLP